MKTCSRCKNSLDEKCFTKDKNRKDGFNKYCRKCNAAIYQENKEKVSEQQKKYYQEHKEQHLEKSREWYERNLEKRKAYRKQYYADHREDSISYSAEWWKNNRDYCRNANQVKKVRRAGGRVEKVDRKKIIERDQSTCQICGEVLSGSEITIDHIQPIAFGGDHIESNLRVLCIHCNCSRNTHVHKKGTKPK